MVNSEQASNNEKELNEAHGDTGLGLEDLVHRVVVSSCMTHFKLSMYVYILSRVSIIE